MKFREYVQNLSTEEFINLMEELDVFENETENENIVDHYELNQTNKIQEYSYTLITDGGYPKSLDNNWVIAA